MTIKKKTAELNALHNKQKIQKIESYTDEQALTSLLHIIAKKDEDDLWTWISIILGVKVPRVSVSGDNTPFEFVRDYIFNEFSVALVLGNRASGKTFDFAIVQAIDAFVYKHIEIANLGAIQEQALKNYSYVRKFNNRFPLNTNVERASLSKTIYKNGTSHQILVATMTGVNSPHPQRGFIDEIDLIPWVILQQAFSMTQSSANAPEKLVLTSTRKFAGGVMQRLINERKQRNLAFYRWNIWDVVKPLPKDNPELLAKILKVFGNELPKNIDKADGFYDWEDLLNKRALLDDDIWEAEWLCNKPGIEGVIYGSSYDDDNNMLQHEYTPAGKGGYVYIFEDFGFGANHPNVNLFVHIPRDFSRVIVFDELYLEESGTRFIIDAVSDKLSEYGLTIRDLRGWFCDPHGLTEIEDRKQVGIRIEPKYDDANMYLVANGISFIRSLLNQGRVMISPKCTQLRTEILSYKYKKQLDGTYTKTPEKKLDHGPDALRYGVVGLYKLLKFIVGDIIKTEKKTPSTPEVRVAKESKSLTAELYPDDGFSAFDVYAS